MTRRRYVGLLLAVGVASTELLATVPHAQATSVVTSTDLPAPFGSWDVTLTPTPGSPGTYALDFDSPALGQRVDNTVYLPNGYSDTGTPSPVLYYLHGTVLPELASPDLTAVTSQEFFVDMVSQGGGDKQTQLFDFASQASAARFVVVAPDTNPAAAICNTCFWVNGQGPTIPLVTQPEQAETFMIGELLPLVQALFNVRTDRAGRGVIGFSMGGWSALLYGLRHPDLFSFVGSVSGVPDTRFTDDPAAGAALEGVGYLRSQGYGVYPLRNPVYDDEFNPADMAANLAGEGVTVFFSTGDACLNLLLDLTAPDCVAHPALLNPAGAAAETLIISANDVGQPRFAAAGVPFASATSPGIHGANNHTIYAKDIVPLANATFARPPASPTAFSFRSADQIFQIWGYTIDTTSPVPAFTSLDTARTDGTSFSISAPNPVTVTTPPTFQPNTPYDVTQRCGSNPPTTTVAVATAQGRISIALPTGPSGSPCSVSVSA